VGGNGACNQVEGCNCCQQRSGITEKRNNREVEQQRSGSLPREQGRSESSGKYRCRANFQRISFNLLSFNCYAQLWTGYTTLIIALSLKRRRPIEPGLFWKIRAVISLLGGNRVNSKEYFRSLTSDTENESWNYHAWTSCAENIRPIGIQGLSKWILSINSTRNSVGDLKTIYCDIIAKSWLS
jgi:hypothetical protein